MPTVKSVIFRNLTDADFFNINKPRGSENSGGGQSYIDFPVKSVSVDEWKEFFNGINHVTETQATQGPCWEFPIHSIGVETTSKTQEIKIYQRRAASVSITSQKLISTQSNRVKSWHPDHGFPSPVDNSIRNQCPDGLMVYLVSTYEGEVWAGWYLNDGMSPSPILGDINETLFTSMLSAESATDGYSQIISFEPSVVNFDTSNKEIPFILDGQEPAASEVTIDNEAEDEESSDVLFNDDLGSETSTDVQVIEQVIKTRKRNSQLVKKLKTLYGHQCQITGSEHTFAKKNGEHYTEAHHLIPLGKGGSDSPTNLVVLSPQIHKMLHYADVSPIELNDMMHMEDGSALLEITINSQPYTIEWHPKHASLFK